MNRLVAIGLSSVIMFLVAAVPMTDARATSARDVSSGRTPIPSDAPRELKRLIGEYSAAATRDYGPDETRLTIGESAGKLYADGFGLHSAALRQLAATRFSIDRGTSVEEPIRLNFEVNLRQQVVAVILGNTRLPRRDIGREVTELIRAGVNADQTGLRTAALASHPPVETEPKRAFDLVDLKTVDPRIKLDIRYAGSNNFVGFPVYEQPAAFLQRPAAEALRRAAQDLVSKGFGLVIFDGYRPWFVTKMFWNATPATAHVFVADPSEGSRHNRGCAVDLTLYDLKSGNAVEMTGRYDEMSRRSYANYPGGTSRERWLRQLLRSEMEAQGFAVYPEEWWHFDYKDWSNYGIGTATFTELIAAK